MSRVRVAFAVFVKTLGLSPIKTRLATDITKEKAEEFYHKSVRVTERTVNALVEEANEAGVTVEPIWAVAEEEGLQAKYWNFSPWAKICQRGSELGERLANAYSHLKSKYDVVCLYGADSPHVSAETLWGGVRKLISNDIVIGPAEDGGFYFFASRAVIAPEVWTSVAYSTSKTLAELREAVLKVAPSSTIAEIEKQFDVDTGADYDRIKREHAF